MCKAVILHQCRNLFTDSVYHITGSSYCSVTVSCGTTNVNHSINKFWIQFMFKHKWDYWLTCFTKLAIKFRKKKHSPTSMSGCVVCLIQTVQTNTLWKTLLYAGACCLQLMIMLCSPLCYTSLHAFQMHPQQFVLTVQVLRILLPT